MSEPAGYVLYGSEQSLFTRKLEAALTFLDAPFTFVSKRGHPDTPAIEARAGTHQVPVLATPEGWMIADTTPIIDLLDQRFPRRALFPAGPLGVLVHLAEEYLDEWTARVMVHYRWHYPDSARFVAGIIAEPAMAETLLAWGPRACRATGTETPFHQQAAEAEYVRLLDAADAQLAQTRYLLGDRPTAVDCMVLGGFRAHTLHDPDPRKVVERYPRLVAWNAAADAWDGRGDLAPFPDSTPFARHLLAEMAQRYAPVLLANAVALAEGRKAFVVDTYGEPASYLTRAYPERARRMIQDRIRHRLTPAEASAVDAWLRNLGLAEAFTAGLVEGV
ncbi:MAG: glutathione S-transferase family protein [Phenylobacterium sp.]|nr:glutathione S-transferase family protein [Phenylobacterium sp.]